MSSFADGIRKHRRAIETLSSRCHDRIGHVRQQLNAITRCEQQIKKAEDHIRDMTIESIAAIRRNERQLLKVGTLSKLTYQCNVDVSLKGNRHIITMLHIYTSRRPYLIAHLHNVCELPQHFLTTRYIYAK